MDHRLLRPVPGDDYVGLAEAIAMVRSELTDARAGGQGEDIRFDVASVVVEFGGEVRREGQPRERIRLARRRAVIQGIRDESNVLSA
ncbi:trypco2 family protein [Streptomyces sp. BF23-18]|uniref:trypco2 family protein n=1 Tax=Streptomyces sp. BF23-18 TaxID=3240282 RepID=UPI0034E376D7